MIGIRVRAAMTVTMVLAFASTLSAPALAQDEPPAQTSASAVTGGAEFGTVAPAATPTVPGRVAQIIDGIAYAPADAPDEVKQIIWAGNEIIGEPYVFGGGHEEDFPLPIVTPGYDCSATVSYALHGADLLKKPRDSSSFFRFGVAGKGEWFTILTKSSHAYLNIADIRLDTSAADDPGGKSGPRWRPLRDSDRGFKARHVRGL